MKSTSIKAILRKKVGATDARKLRRENNIPCVLYGGKEVVHFYAPALSLKKIIYTPEIYSVNFNIEGKEYKAIMKDIQFHPVNDKPLHIDFQELVPDKSIILELPVKFNGIAEGTKEGGVLLAKLRTLQVKGFPDKIPENIELDVENLDIGDSIKVREVTIEGIEILNQPTIPIVTIAAPRTEQELEAQLGVEGEEAEEEEVEGEEVEGEEGEGEEGEGEGKEGEGKEGKEGEGKAEGDKKTPDDKAKGDKAEGKKDDKAGEKKGDEKNPKWNPAQKK